MRKKVLILSLLGLSVLTYQNCSQNNSFNSIDNQNAQAVSSPDVNTPNSIQQPDSSANNNCSFYDTTIPNGESLEVFAQSSVPYGDTCLSESRLCVNGVLSGSFTKESCSIEPKPQSLCQPSDCDYTITNLSELEAITSGRSSASIRYCLSDDLDLGSAVDPVIPLNLSNIELNGCGYSIRNFQIQSKPLFANLSLSEIKQVNFDNFSVHVLPGTGHENFGAIIGLGNDVQIKDVQLRNLNQPRIQSGGFSDIKRCGLLAGTLKGEVSGLLISGDNLNISGCYYMGAAIGTWNTQGPNNNNIDSVTIDINIQANHYDNFGPLIGYLAATSNNRPEILISNVQVRSQIIAGANDCQVPDIGLGRCAITGGVVGRIDYISDPFIFLNNLLFQGSVTIPDTQSSIQAGGLIGHIYYAPSSNFAPNFTNAKVEVNQSQVIGTLDMKTTKQHNNIYGGHLIGSTAHKKHLVLDNNNTTEFKTTIQGQETNNLIGRDASPYQY